MLGWLSEWSCIMLLHAMFIPKENLSPLTLNYPLSVLIHPNFLHIVCILFQTCSALYGLVSK